MKELKEKALKLGLAVYRVTKLYPGGEVLIFQTRELANQILSDLVSDQKLKAAKKFIMPNQDHGYQSHHIP